MEMEKINGVYHFSCREGYITQDGSKGGLKVWLGRGVWHWDQYYRRILKSGKESKNIYWRPVYYTRLNECQMCGKIGIPKRVNNREVIGWDAEKNNEGRYMLEKANYHTMFCMKCWNKIQPIYKNVMESEEIRLGIQRLSREIGKCRKLQQQVI